MTRSEQLFERAVKRIPGGVNSPVRSYGAIGEAPRFIEKADKCYIYDVDGNRYVDYIDSWGPMILGHNFPFYMEFKGGKGIAASAGLLASTDWRVMLVCLVVFVAAVAITRYVSLGSILVMICFFIGMVFCGWRGDFGIAAAHLTEFYVLAGLISAMGIWRHHANIKRLLSGTENKLGARKE